MANYTMTIYELMNNPLTQVFPSDYPFYCEDERCRKEFEETFILHYLTNEIGFETPYLFNQKLLGKLKLIMPYYEQLYQTEWKRVGKDMMNQKDLVDKTTHTLTQTLKGEQQSKQNNQSSDTLNANSNSSSNGKSSNLADGVSSATLTDGYLTSVIQSTDETTGSNQSESHSNSTLSNSSNTQTILEETTINESHGDIGIQTPAYAITEWRNIIININQLIIEDCRDLFMKLY
nr:MAG TPA: Lower collar protein [Caudoviricetes sp.]